MEGGEITQTMPLSQDKILELYANRRTKGLYEEKLAEKNATDEPGFDPREDYPALFGKKNATTLYQGFRNAAEKLDLEDQVEVIQRDGNVFILFKSRVEPMLLESLGVNGDEPETVEDES